jgi:hypothetical protein
MCIRYSVMGQHCVAINSTWSYCKVPETRRSPERKTSQTLLLPGSLSESPGHNHIKPFTLKHGNQMARQDHEP